MNAILPNTYAQPDAEGRFGPYGGRFVPETLMPLVLQLDEAYAAAKADPSFQAELDGFLTHYVGRESPLYFAERLTEHFGGARIWPMQLLILCAPVWFNSSRLNQMFAPAWCSVRRSAKYSGLGRPT